MAEKRFPNSGLPIRKTEKLLPGIFQTEANNKFMEGVVDPLVQPGVLEKLSGYIGRRYGRTYNASGVYLDNDETLRSRYQLEPGVVVRKDDKVEKFYDYIDLINQLEFFGNSNDRDDKLTTQEHYTWNPPIDWDKFVNYREYFWIPLGPPPVQVAGQRQGITSTYSVRQGIGSSWIFTPDGATNNPSVTLYRGQTYNFNVNSPGEGFVIRTEYDTGSLIFDATKNYAVGDLAVFDSKLWRARVAVSPVDGSTITENSEDWELVDGSPSNSSFDYSGGLVNNGTTNGTVTFTVPLDAPDILFYQSSTDPNRLGRFVIADVESNTVIDVEKEVIGKSTYTSSNDISFTNGLVVEFTGTVIPEKYSQGQWVVEGVGSAITLTLFTDLVAPEIVGTDPDVLFDDVGFDTQPYDDAIAYPASKDYITVKKDSRDLNPWTRYNRWFHRTVLEYAYGFRDSDFDAFEGARAKRPIIEFSSNIKLFNHGAVAKQTVDYIDTFTDDVFSKIEGQPGYSIDGEFLFDGARILVVSDTDSLANNRIYTVKFITHNGRRQINLRDTLDSESFLDECVLVRRGSENAGLMYHFNGTEWVASQSKTAVNQPPLIELFDENGVSFADEDTYPVSSFTGTPLIKYAQGTGPVDSELGFAISYLNINNVGDIQFDWTLDNETFTYEIDRKLSSVNYSTGFFKIADELDNGWQPLSNDYIQPIIDSVILQKGINRVTLDALDWDEYAEFVINNENSEQASAINFYLNGELTELDFVRTGNQFTFDKSFNENDVLTVKIIGNVAPDKGYYQIPVTLEKNPLNQDLKTFTLGEATDHVRTSVEFSRTFTGALPGNSNLRDLNDYQSNAARFLKHSGVGAITLDLLCDKENNLIRSIQFAKSEYSKFKSNFLKKSGELDFDSDVVNFVDTIINDLTKTKNSSSPFADSDMIGSGAFTSIDYTVDDPGINTFSLSQNFDLNELSRTAVYVYKNNVQLLEGTDYEFDGTFGFINMFVELVEGDQIQIREYVSTSFNHIPPTPTKLGLWKKYTPLKFIDDTYVEPRLVIQGHDGSITSAFGDYRDDILLELEYRIYNNIKQEYDTSLFDIDANLGGYHGNSVFNKTELDDVVSQEFLRWLTNTDVNYTTNTFFDSENSFTYTYSNMTDPTGTQNLPGYWRGVYQWAYDTDRPHRCPWEMLGFSEKPDWWDDEYGEAPYTRGNLILWGDIEEGIIRQGDRSGRYDRYARPGLTDHIPVDDDGNLLSPLDSGFATNFVLVNNQGSFKLGDIAPVEYAWRSSSEWPFAVISALTLLKPFEFVARLFDKSRVKRNILNQLVDTNTNVFKKLNDIVLPSTTGAQTSGLVNYIAAYKKDFGVPVENIGDDLYNIDVALSSRLSGFVDQAQQKYLLDSKNPSSASSSIFIPPENYDIIFNVSSPVSSVTYSGVIIEKTNGGWILKGYDLINPYFEYYEAVENQKDPALSVGGVSENFVEWTANQRYNNGTIASFRNDFYRCISTHTSTENFDTSLWVKLPKLPVTGAIEAQKRRNFNSRKTLRLSYGTTLTTVQSIVDFLLGYEARLKDLGFVFNSYDAENQVSQDWTTSAREFMYWSKHNWAVGSLITLSAAAEILQLRNSTGVTESLIDSFYDYTVLNSSGEPFPVENINVSRDFQDFVISVTNTTDGIYYLKVNYVLKEHVVIFDDRTVFNDIIFDKSTGYRQERIKTLGFRTVDWDGDYTSPGFLFDNVNISAWQPFVDYNLGDIVNYRSYNWTSLVNQNGQETFDESKWTRLDSEPTKRLVPNFDYRINEFEDYFEVASVGVSDTQKDLARHTVGYQTREYLENLAEDEVTQFRLYQGFIREKGTNNAITKLFEKLSNNDSESSVTLNEEWAVKVGTYGGIDQSTEYELGLNYKDFLIDPQPILVTNESGTFYDQYYRVSSDEFTITPVPFTSNIIPTKLDRSLKTAGYVKLDQPNFVVRTRDDLLNLDITQVSENDHIWVTFDNVEWTVLRYNVSPQLYITGLTVTDGIVELILSRPHHFVIGDIVGIKEVENLTGFYKISNTTHLSISITLDEDADEPDVTDSSVSNIGILTEVRFPNYEQVDEKTAALLQDESKLYIDNNGNGLWEVIQKQRAYTSKKIVNYGVSEPRGTGSSVLYIDSRKHILASMPESGYVVNYVEGTLGLNVKQIIEPQDGLENTLIGSFGNSIAVSPDNKWLVVGAPLASGVKSNYKGPYDPFVNYLEDDIVVYNGKLWRSKTTSPNYIDGFTLDGDGSTINTYSQDWELTESIPARANGSAAGLSRQGLISIYEYRNDQWELFDSFVSPRPSPDENFGSSISIGVDGDEYFMAVSAPNALNGVGRVYLYKYGVKSDGASIGWHHIEDDNYRGIYNPGAEFVGTIDYYAPLNRYVLTVDSVSAGFVEEGLSISGTGILPNTYVGTFISGARGGPGIYLVNNDQTVSGIAITGTMFYPQGTIVWDQGNLWQAQNDSYSDGSTVTVQSSGDWIQLDDIATNNSLPSSVAIADDGSTLASGILTSSQTAALVKAGDKFGSSVSMNYDGSLLIVGAPFSDEQFFANYRGEWKSNYEYSEGDVVNYQGTYHQLVDFDNSNDSSLKSYNQEPVGLPWQNVGDSSTNPTGKVFVYKRLDTGRYSLEQTISANNVINDDSATITIDSGDEFGHSLDIDASGTKLVVSSPRADINFQNQGSAYVFTNLSTTNPEFRLIQELKSYENYPSEYFGDSVSISNDTGKIAIGATNANYKLPTRFDASATTFDDTRTRWYGDQGSFGAVYVFDLKSETYFLTEKLESDLSLNESFGSSIDCHTNSIVIGSPNYVESTVEQGNLVYGEDKIGTVRLFRKDPNLDSWTTLSIQEPVADISKIKSIELYDDVNNLKIADIDVVDHAKLKIVNSAEQEIKFKTPYDPAVYSIGTSNQVVDSQIAWTTKHKGELWWDLSTVKWIDYEQGDISYRSGNWNRLAAGATVDVYEWVESILLPSEWSLLADTNEGLALGVSGQPLYPDDSVYSQKILFNASTELPTSTKYYYWVRNKVIVPSDVVGRKISASEVASLIRDPSALGIAYLGLADSDKLITFNFTDIISEETALLNLQFYKEAVSQNQVHNEYQLLTEGDATSIPASKIEQKWIDSLAGYDDVGNKVPDERLPAKQKYGIKFRPRQSMFIDRFRALKIAVERINSVLLQEPFANLISFENLNLVDEIPSESLNLYDLTVDNFIDLETVGTIRVRRAELSVNLIDGELDTIDIVDAGFGYKVAPSIEFDGNGTGAMAETVLDNQGRVIAVNVLQRGKKYSTLRATVRQFSVLVKTDNTANRFWGIYAWDDIRKVFYRSRSQAFNTTRYWNLVDWWKSEYSPADRITIEIGIAAEEPSIQTEIGDLIRIKEYGSGGWAVFEKILDSSETLLGAYQLIGREKGTIELDESLYNSTLSGIGYDQTISFDADFYDVENAKEIKNILRAVKHDIFINEYAVEWNQLFFSLLRYVFVEQLYVDWAFKTSFLNATHNVGELRQKLNYKNDSLTNYQNYVDEVKPYRTSIREYISKYDKVDSTQSAVTDFDLPPVYNVASGKIIPITQFNTEVSSYPWKWWSDNQGYSIASIVVTNSGSGYVTPPNVLIDGDGTGAQAQAYISSGRVSAVTVISSGSGYTRAPIITLVGGNANADISAKAVAVLGNSLFRNLNITAKFDRISKTGTYQNFTFSEQFTASGSSAVFELKYAPTRDKSKITILKNGYIVLTSDYDITLYTPTRTDNKLVQGRITFKEAPALGDIIDIEYEKNDELLDSVNRIQKYYSPSQGMKGDDLSQLMTGIDFGGVQVQGTTFDVTGGWDALPWFTDNWDSVEASSDYYVVVDGSTTSVTLPYIPAAGQEINVYLKRDGNAQLRSIDDLQYSQEIPEPDTVRIDDPNYNENWDSSIATNPNAQMPTFVGDGITSIVEIGEYIQTNAGDILIFRPAESDGSVVINDPNILDTRLSGGSLSAMDGAYVTANGLSAEDISIDGGSYNNPNHTPATEENIPGQILDSLSLKVYQSTLSGAAPINTSVKFGDGNTVFYNIGQRTFDVNSILVYVDKVRQTHATDYVLDLNNNRIEFITAPTIDSVVEIVSIGVGGIQLLDYQEFVGDGETDYYLTSADYIDTVGVYVSINGIQNDIGFLDSGDILDIQGKTLINFAQTPEFNDSIRIIVVGATTDTDTAQLGLVGLNEQEFIYTGNRSFDIDHYIQLPRGSELASAIVEVNGIALQGIDSIYEIYNGVDNQITIGLDPLQPPGAILNSNIKVFVNDELLEFITDYVYEGTNRIVIIEKERLTIGDVIKIENDFKCQYTIRNGNLNINSDVTLANNDIVKITWFDEYPSMKIVSDEYTGGKISYRLKFIPLTASYVWVYNNGVRLTQDQDYYVDIQKGYVYLTGQTNETDLIKIILFSRDIYKSPSAFEIYKDMLNVYHFNSYSITDIVLTKELTYYDTDIEVNDANALSNPLPEKNIPGVIEIGKEKIEYFSKSGNTLSQLRRGAQGSSIGTIYAQGSRVIDLGTQQKIPYTESQDRLDFVSDGSSVLIGPLDFIPSKSANTDWHRETIPNNFGQCDSIEVFVGGTRLRKSPVTVYDETIASISPAGDKIIEAQFSVNGEDNYIRLTEAPSAGTRISVIKKTGRSWYDRGETSATSGITLFNNNTPIAKFIADRTTELPE